MSYKIPTEKTLEIMVLEEEHIRSSKAYQDECTRVKDNPNGWLEVTKKIQENIVKRYGFDDPTSMNIALDMFRRARYIYPNNPNFKKGLHIVNNKSSNGTLSLGDLVPDIKVHDSFGKTVRLEEICSNKTYVFAGSNT